MWSIYLTVNRKCKYWVMKTHDFCLFRVAVEEAKDDRERRNWFLKSYPWILSSSTTDCESLVNIVGIFSLSNCWQFLHFQNSFRVCPSIKRTSPWTSRSLTPWMAKSQLHWPLRISTKLAHKSLESSFASVWLNFSLY